MLGQDYCYHYGSLWLSSSPIDAQRQQDLDSFAFTAFSEPIMWLLKARNLPSPNPSEQRKHRCCYHIIRAQDSSVFRLCGTA
jgi:hypothetical protein